MILFVWQSVSAQTAKVNGVVIDSYEQLVEGVSVSVGGVKTQTNENGFYELELPAEQQLYLVFQHPNFHKAEVYLLLKLNEVREVNLQLKENTEEIETIVIDYVNEQQISGAVGIAPDVIRRIPGANAGVENILKTLPGVYSNNELSTQYAVRGGNYDENLVYVNEVEVYRPFLIRSGQQEGLGFTNSSMVQNVHFSAGGFQSKYGDKMASVLDITYRIPTKFKAQLDASILGGGLTVDLVSKNQKWNAVSGVRYRNNALLVKTQDVQVDYKPQYLDFQALINFNASAKWQWSFLGNISQNIYDYTPKYGRTNFGTIENPLAMFIAYEGQEQDRYNTYFGALKSTFKASENSTYKWITSVYHTRETEHYDILGNYNLGEIDTDMGSNTYGDILYTTGVGSQLNHGRNNYSAIIASTELKGQHKHNEHQIEWGVRYLSEKIKDRLIEWEVIDSAGFSIVPPGEFSREQQPYVSYQGDLLPYQYVRATNHLKINRVQAFAQWSRKTYINKHQLWTNLGVRAHAWNIAQDNTTHQAQLTLSPRFQIAFKPNWKEDMFFRFSAGLYHQPPSYRELRTPDGTINAQLKAQQSFHFVLANEYSFKIKQTPFKLISEIYYKDLSKLNTYTLENVRIRYRGDNNAVGYVYGADFRLNTQLLPGSDSWISFGYLKTEENYNNRGYIARPTDQRLKFGLMFQDYMPNIPNLKMYLNLVYNTGLPGGSPSYADPYNFQHRLRDYRRADAGFSYVFKDETVSSEKTWLQRFDEVVLGFEIYNMFNNANAITNTWIRDVYSKSMYAIPNRMTMRTFNIKMTLRL